MRRVQSAGLVVAMAAWLAGGPGSGEASGQLLANGVINSLEKPPAGSLEWQILDRLAVTQKYDPRDLVRLARLTVLESIGMYQTMRADLRQTIMGERLEGEMSLLWEASQLFYIDVAPVEEVDLPRARSLLGEVETAYQQLGATLGSMSGISQPASFHLGDIGRLVAVMDGVLNAMEAEAPPAAAPATLDIAALREQARLLIDDLRGAAGSLAALQPPPADRAALTADLERIVDLVQGFDRVLASGAPMPEVVESLRLLRSRMWPVQARLLVLASNPEIANRWRRIRQRMNAIADRFDRPRVVVTRPAAARPGTPVDRRLLAEADGAIVALDDFVRTLSTNGASTLGSRFREELGQFRRRLFLLRQQVAAGEPGEVVARSVAQVVALNRSVAELARAEARIYRGGVRVDPRALAPAVESVERLRGAFTQSKTPSSRPDRR